MKMLYDTSAVLIHVLYFALRSGLFGLCQDRKWEDSSVCAASAAETVRGPVWYLLPGAHSHQVSAEVTVANLDVYEDSLSSRSM